MNQAPVVPARRERVRSTERADSAVGPVARKTYRRSGLLDRLGWRERPAVRELAMLRRLRGAGLPTPEPLELLPGGGEHGEDVLVTRWIEGAVDLAAAWDAIAGDATARRRLARLVGELVRALHEAGVVHRDLHAGNVLVRAVDGRLEAFLADFHGAKATRSERARRRDLLSLGHHFLARTRATERLRFLRAACSNADARSLARAALRSRHTFQRHHERRCDAGGRAFVRLRRGVARAEHAALASELGGDADAIATLVRARGRLVHRSAGGDAELWRLELPGAPFPIAVKLFDDRGPLRRLLRGSRARRAWRNLFRLEMAQLPTPRGVGLLESPIATLRPRSALVTEFLDERERLDESLARRDAAGSRPLLKELAGALARMHDDGLSNRDLKAQNLLVERAGTAVAFVDLDGIRRVGAVGPARAARDLMRLNASFADGGTVSWRERGRFLVAWRRARCVLRPPLRDLWTAIASLTRTKWRRRSDANPTAANR